MFCADMAGNVNEEMPRMVECYATWTNSNAHDKNEWYISRLCDPFGESTTKRQSRKLNQVTKENQDLGIKKERVFACVTCLITQTRNG
jgi:hypothetical protein